MTTQTGQLTQTETKRDFRTVDRETSKEAADHIFPIMGSSASKKEEQIGDNKASMRGLVSMDENMEYSCAALHCTVPHCSLHNTALQYLAQYSTIL